MPFKALFIAHAPDADYKNHRNVIDTGKKDFLQILNKLESVNATKPKSILFYMKKLQEMEENKK